MCAVQVKGFAPPAAQQVNGVDEMRSLSKSNPDWKKKEQEAKTKGSKCASSNCNAEVGKGGVTSMTIEHKFPAALIWARAKNKQTMHQMRRHFTNPSNLILLCKSCNSSKGGKTFNQFAADSGRMSAQQGANLQASANAFRDALLKL